MPDDDRSDSDDSLLRGIAHAPERPPPGSTKLAAALAVPAEPRLEEVGLVGKGGMGWVYRVLDHNIGRYAALKLLDDELATRPEASQAFRVEAQITGQLEHPNVVPVYDLQLTENGAPRYFTMKLVEGRTLASLVDAARIAERPEGELWDLLGVFLKICDAVAFAHSRGVVHRDLKPDNVMVGSHGQVYVLDWGIAHVMEGSQVRVGADGTPGGAAGADAAGASKVIGTYQYMAPEQTTGRLADIDTRTDVFALGGVLYYVLTGRAPYGGLRLHEVHAAVREARVRPPEQIADGRALPPALCAIAMKAMARAPADRYGTVEELRRDVERAMRGGLALARRAFPAGTLIVREGDPPDAAYILTQGRCEAFRGSGDERNVLRTMGPGEVFGEMALLSARPRSASVVALDDVTALVITRDVLEREVHADSWLVALLKTLVERFRELDERK